ncbi:MAG: hypothetical protein ISN29_07740 [Gammaproteobacteria bacterium AqS3]|nr:hypothetical protein [Gammaproteobacteria bacterium AqS3]
MGKFKKVAIWIVVILLGLYLLGVVGRLTEMTPEERAKYDAERQAEAAAAERKRRREAREAKEAAEKAAEKAVERHSKKTVKKAVKKKPPKLLRWNNQPAPDSVEEIVKDVTGGWYEAGMLDDVQVKKDHQKYTAAVLEWEKIAERQEVEWEKRKRLWRKYEKEWRECREVCGGFLTVSCDTCDRRRPHPRAGRHIDIANLDRQNERLLDARIGKANGILAIRDGIEEHLRKNYDVVACRAIKDHKAKRAKLKRKQRRAAKKECEAWRAGKPQPVK